MPQIEFVDTVADVRERALDAFRNGTTRMEGAGDLPGRFFVAWLRRVKVQARRSDVVGVAARGVLEVVHGPAAGAASFFTTIERESSPPRRGARRKAASSQPRGRAAGKRSGTTRSTATTGRASAASQRNGARRTGARRSATQPAAPPQTEGLAAVEPAAPEEVLPIIVS